MNLTEKLESLECRRDDKARRVVNVAPDTVANVTAEQLEKGMTLEALESLNVPVLRYSTQVTIHGILTDFNPNARPGGYKAIFRNQNGSVGMRYSAIDAEKKTLLARIAKVSGTEWGAHNSSTGFSLVRAFYVHNEEECATQKAATIAALKAVPVSRFYGTVGAFCLAYGMGYAVEISIGAIPQTEFWLFVSELFNGLTTERFVELDKLAKEAEEKRRAEWEAECAANQARREAETAKHKAELIAFLSTLTGKRLTTVPRENGTVFLRYSLENRDSSGAFVPIKTTFAKRGARLCYQSDRGNAELGLMSERVGKWKAIEARNFAFWDKCAERGEIFAVESAEPIQSKPVEAVPTLP